MEVQAPGRPPTECDANEAVVKLGSQVLVMADRQLDRPVFESLAQDVAELRQRMQSLLALFVVAVLFFVLAFGMLGFVAKNIIEKLWGI